MVVIQLFYVDILCASWTRETPDGGEATRTAGPDNRSQSKVGSRYRERKLWNGGTEAFLSVYMRCALSTPENKHVGILIRCFLESWTLPVAHQTSVFGTPSLDQEVPVADSLT